MSRLLCVLLLALLLPGCGNVSYYLQSVRGQWEIWQRQVPIDELLSDPQLDPALRKQLQRAVTIRAYASRELGLPDNASYRAYADLARPFVVWNVFVAAEFSVEPRQWCFPVAGCVNYRGYFEESAARGLARELAASGDDVYIGGVPAYSTLGWFSDPVLNTFVHYPETELARLIFHELAHQIVYVKDDTVFNESFATAVEQAGMARWLQTHGTAAQREQYARLQAFRTDFRALILDTREQLRQLYAADLPVAEKRRQKKLALDHLRAAYARQKDSWGGFTGYDRWFAQPLGNAHLASVAVYTQQLPAFKVLLADNGNDLPRFYAAVRALADEPPVRRREQLEALAARSRWIPIGYSDWFLTTQR